MGLITEIGADASNYNKVMAGLGPTATTASNEVSKSLASASKAADVLGGSVAKGSNAAMYALTNLGRVAQDLPFGFIGIQNNLNPLLESFQRLKAETGSTGSALKAIVGSLMGAGGMGLALSVVTSAITIFTMWQQKAGRATKDVKDETKSYVDTLDSVSKAQLKGQQDGQSELTRLSLLYNATQNHKLSLEQRNAAYDELEAKYPKHFTNADREKTLLGENTEAYNKLAVSIMNAAQAKAFENQITENTSKGLENEKKVTDLLAKQNKIKADLAKANSDNQQTGSSDITAGQNLGAQADIISLNKQLAQSYKDVQAINRETNQINKDNADLTKRAMASEIAADFKTTQEIDGKTDKLKEQKTTLQLLEDELKKLQDAEVKWLEAGNKQDFFNLTDTERNINALIAKITALKAATQSVGAPTAKGTSDFTIDTTMKSQATGDDMAKTVAGVTQLNNEKRRAIILNKEFKKTTLEEDSVLKTLSNTVGNGLTNAFQSALSGTQSFASAFGEFILGLIEKIVAAIAAAAILAAVLSFTGLSAFTSTAGAFSGGADKFGSFTNLLGQFSGVKLASGGITTGPTHALIGEGKEQEAVLPLSHLSTLMGNNSNSGMADGHIVGVLSGADLLLQFKRAQKQANRIGGNA